jgi:nitrogen regulatory protein P-II 1
MKYIIAIIQPTRLEAVKEALSHIEVFRLTVSDAEGVGRQKGHTEIYRGHEYKISFIRKTKLEIAVNDQFLEPTIEAITTAARTGKEGQIGDGKIFVLPLEDVLRIRTRERGSEAI